MWNRKGHNKRNNDNEGASEVGKSKILLVVKWRHLPVKKNCHALHGNKQSVFCWELNCIGLPVNTTHSVTNLTYRAKITFKTSLKDIDELTGEWNMLRLKIITVMNEKKPRKFQNWNRTQTHDLCSSQCDWFRKVRLGGHHSLLLT